MGIPSTHDRVPDHTAGGVNEQIRQATERQVGRIGSAKALIPQRLEELDAEWDIERAIETNAALIAFVGVALGFFVHPYWLVIPALVAAFLFQRAVQGWCPPVPILRRLGFRTADEIGEERMAIKAIRGDFDGIAQSEDKAPAALRASRIRS